MRSLNYAFQLAKLAKELVYKKDTSPQKMNEVLVWLIRNIENSIIEQKVYDDHIKIIYSQLSETQKEKIKESLFEKWVTEMIITVTT